MPSFQKMEMGEILSSLLNVQLNFPIGGLALIVKKEFLIHSFATHGIFFNTLSLSWGNIILPFMIHRKFQILLFEHL